MQPQSVFVAGATGTLGLPLVRSLAARGHRVVGLTRSPAKRALLEGLGARAVIGDAFDGEALARAMVAAAPDVVIDLLTAIPPRGSMRAKHMQATNELRRRATPLVIAAARTARARRLIAESMIFAEAEATGPLEEVVLALREKEHAVRLALGLETFSLRFGLLYGSESPSTRALFDDLQRRRRPVITGAPGLVSFVHVDDAVAAIVAALDRGVPGTTYDVVDDQPATVNDWTLEAARLADAPPPRRVPFALLRLFAPYLASVLAARVHADNRETRRDLEWRPRYPTVRDGLREVAAALELERLQALERAPQLR